MPSNGGFGGVSVGKPTVTTDSTSTPNQTTNTTPLSKPDSNLTASLRGSLQIIESQDSANPFPSPLNEATPDSVDILLDRINNHMIEGKILSDADLRHGIDLYRSQALKYAQDQQTKKPRAKSGPKSSIKEVLDLDFDLALD